jgi:hypothetical protein
MSPNPHLEQRLLGIQKVLVALYEGGFAMPSASKGNEREAFAREFLRTIFPAHRRLGQGAITDARGRLSGQVDIVIEFGHAPSFPMPNSEERLYLADAVALAIEVKSNLTDQWDQVRATAKKIKALDRRLGAIMTVGGDPPEKIPFIAIGYKGNGTVEQITARLKKVPAAERPDAVLIIESGVAVTAQGAWATGPWGLYMICLLINQYLTQVAHAMPNLEAYVAPPPVAVPAMVHDWTTSITLTPPTPAPRKATGKKK